MLVFPDFNKPFLLTTDTSNEGLGAVLSQKQDDGCYHPIAFGSQSLTPAEKNYYSLKLEFLALKWGVTEHFKEYLAYVPFVIRTDNNPLMYVLTTPNLDATGHRWVGALASFDFVLEYQKGATCKKWLKAHMDTPPQKRDALLKNYLGSQVNMEEGCALFCICNSLILSKGLLYISTMPKGEVDGVLAFLVPSSQHTVALNGVHHDVGHQGQQRTLALAQECF